jgi:uncharacterized RDD family membrane protein YckC
MPCPVCGDICRCSAEATSIPAQSAEWKREVAARLNRYQSRRKPRPPRYPSLRLRFDNADSPVLQDAAVSDRSSSESARFIQGSNHALALDEFSQDPDRACEAPAPRAPDLAHEDFAKAPGDRPESAVALGPASSAKIIEFPRSWAPPARPVDELAEPVMTSPRILEVPEFVPPPPALGGITIEPGERAEIERRPGIDFPLQSVPSRRFAAAAIDGVIIAAACVLFGWIFWKLTGLRPPRLQILEISASLAGALWAAYQYLLIVHSGRTPGLYLARLELARFDGRAANRRLRRWRVLASFLSAVSLGMGYAWVFLDEDALCWHDRITHTYLAPKAEEEKVSETGSA